MFEKPHLQGYIVLGRKKGDNSYLGTIENSFSLGLSKDFVQFHWSSDNATSNFGGNFKVDGLECATETKEYHSRIDPDIEFEIYDVHDEEKLPVIIDWDQWREDSSAAATLSGVKNKFGARNPKFTMKE